MPLALQAIVPLLVLLAAAVVVNRRRGKRENGWIAAGATAAAAIIALVELLRLAPGEHVDVPYVTTFPYADLLIRLDGLSLGFTTVTLITAAFLMLVRQWDAGDRRDPWTGWLLTTAAAAALMLGGNLLLLYITLQVLTLAWSGAVDETAPRRRRLRLTLQVADVGLLLAAASAIQSVGTSSFSGVPSDTFGVASFWLMMLPVMARVGALAAGIRRPLAAVAFGPVIAWLAPAAYIMMRVLALLGGRLPDRPTAVVLFVLAVLSAIGFALAALWSSASRLSSLLLAAQACVALALSSGSEPLLTVAAAWTWLLLIPLAGLVSLRTAAHPWAEALERFQLSMLPGSLAFTGIWLAALTLNALGLVLGIVPLLIAVGISTLAVLRHLRRPRTPAAHPIVVWGAALLVIGAFPIIALNPIVLPSTTAIRTLAPGTAATGPLGLTTSLGPWPAFVVLIVVALAVVAADRFLRPYSRSIITRAGRLAVLPPIFGRVRWADARWWSGWRSRARTVRRTWASAVLWTGLAIVVIVSLARP